MWHVAKQPEGSSRLQTDLAVTLLPHHTPFQASDFTFVYIKSTQPLSTAADRCV